MRSIILLLFTILMGLANAQTWKSIPKSQGHLINPIRFVSNPYLNQLWFIQDLQATVIENDGEVRHFTQTELGSLSAGVSLNFAFTSEHIYYSNNVFGLFSFDEYISNPIYSSSEIMSIKSNEDTVYLINGNDGFDKFYGTGMISTNKIVYGIAAKNDYLYLDIGTMAKITGPNQSDLFLMYTDPQYSGGPYYDYKFSRNTDSLYVAGKKGIDVAYNYDFLDTIAPSNSIDMPARNVLEIEFDHLDRLWAVFGNASNQAFAMARFENGTWVERYDASNCPIDFATYRGFEIDTLGNIWVVDNYNLHTLLTPNSPQWLSTVELNPEISIDLYPNPSTGMVHLSSSENIEAVAVYDGMGKLVYAQKMDAAKIQEVNLSFLDNGNYLLEASSGNTVSRSKLVLVK